MIMTVEELRKYITTEATDMQLEAMLRSLELSIRRYTNNNFQIRTCRVNATITDAEFITTAIVPFKAGDTIQVSESALNEGLYTVQEIGQSSFIVNEEVTEEKDVCCTKIEYPFDVQMGAAKIVKWQLKNEAASDGDKSAMPVQSETISRHSVTYAQDGSEFDISEDFGCPKKYLSFLKMYRKARF